MQYWSTARFKPSVILYKQSFKSQRTYHSPTYSVFSQSSSLAFPTHKQTLSDSSLKYCKSKHSPCSHSHLWVQATDFLPDSVLPTCCQLFPHHSSQNDPLKIYHVTPKLRIFQTSMSSYSKKATVLKIVFQVHKTPLPLTTKALTASPTFFSSLTYFNSYVLPFLLKDPRYAEGLRI